MAVLIDGESEHLLKGERQDARLLPLYYIFCFYTRRNSELRRFLLAMRNCHLAFIQNSLQRHSTECHREQQNRDQG